MNYLRGIFFWLFSSLMFLSGLILQIVFGLFTLQLMKSLSLDTTDVGHLVASAAYLHIVMQCVGGGIVDRFGARAVMSVGCILAALSGWALMNAETFTQAVVFRLLMGLGLSCGFLCMTFLSANWLPSRYFGLSVSVSEMLAILGACVLEVFLGQQIESLSWRTFVMNISWGIGVLAVLSLVFVRNRPSHMESDYPRSSWVDLWGQFRHLLTLPQAWLNGLYSGTLFCAITGFCASWGSHFFALARGESLHAGAINCGVIMLGTALGALYVGWVSTKDVRLTVLMCWMSLINIVTFAWVIVMPDLGIYWLNGLLFVLGFSAAGYLLSFPLASTYVPAGSRTSIMGFTNMLSVLVGPVMITLTSLVIEYVSATDAVLSLKLYTVLDYQYGLILYPAISLIGLGCAYRLACHEEVH